MIKICTQLEIPKKESVKAALDERPDNLVDEETLQEQADSADTPAMAVSHRKLWKNGRSLKVAFIDDTPPEIRHKVMKYASELLQHVNLKFDFVAGTEGDIRISTRPGGSDSYVGTDATDGKLKGKATMHFGWLRNNPGLAERDFRQVVLHEFCHAIGCEHEMQAPGAAIPWNKEKVYAFYAKQGWSRDYVDANVFRKLDASTIKTTGYDPASIMHYPVSKELTDGHWHVDGNYNLSEKDKDMLRRSYPKA